MRFLSHNSGSRYAREPINDSTDSDDRLVSNTFLRQKMAFWIAAQGQVKLAKDAKIGTHCDVANRNPQTQFKKFFKSKLQGLPNPWMV